MMSAHDQTRYKHCTQLVLCIIEMGRKYQKHCGLSHHEHALCTIPARMDYFQIIPSLMMIFDKRAVQSKHITVLADGLCAKGILLYYKKNLSSKHITSALKIKWEPSYPKTFSLACL